MAQQSPKLKDIPSSVVSGVLEETKRSLKRPLVDDGNESDDHKRRRTDHDRDAAAEDIDSPQYGSIGLGPIYKFCQQRETRHVQLCYKIGSMLICLTIAHPPSQPHGTQNLMELYGLTNIATSVLRKDPVTGAKINVLRKSYEGKIKELSGKNKAKVAPREFTNLMQYPDEEWDIQKVHGKEVENGLPDGIMAELEKAVKMLPGKLPEEDQRNWDSFLNEPGDSKKLDDATAAAAVNEEKGNTSRSRTTSQHAKYTSSIFNEPPRPKRQGTKRRYNDEAFEGYGEGFVDDGADSASFTDESDVRTLKKKRRKVRGRAQR